MGKNEKLENTIDELIRKVSKYEPESFAGFFAYFIKRRPEDIIDIELNKFKSKLKDFFYLIALNTFAENKGDEPFDFSPATISELADLVNEIRSYYHIQKLEDYTEDAAIHEMAFRNYFDNGVLSYVEQDLEKIRTVFQPFDDKLIEAFGLDVGFLIEVYKASELVTKIRFDQVMAFTHTKEFNEFHAKIHSKQITFSEGIDQLPEEVSNALLSFHAKTHTYLLFSKEDLYHTLDKEKVDKFLGLFSCKPEALNSFRYYTDNNPIELAPILEISENKYLHICQKQIPVAIHRRMYDFLSKDESLKDKIRRHREKELERKVAAILRSVFNDTSSFFYENYFVVEGHEQDLLILTKGTAIIVETKASKLREPFRDMQKAIVRLKSDFKEAVQYGYDQCKQVENFFLREGPFDIKDNKGKLLYTVNPTRFHSVFSIVVTLERFGSLQTDLNLLLQKDSADNYPWSVYIDDLEIFLLTLKHHRSNPQGKFLDFLRNRRLLHGHMYAIDELDVCGYYLKQPEKFADYSKRIDTLCQFSVYEQAIFDEIYHSGGLRFKEEPMPDFYRYFGSVKKGSRPRK
jgi:hypothetical protein